MFKEKLEKVIEEIQSKNKELTKFPSLLEVCNPGETGFKPKKVSEYSGYVLLCGFKVAAKERVIKEMQPGPADFMGVSPFMMVVMESGNPTYAPGDIVFIEPRMMEALDTNFVIVKSAIGYLMPDSIILGVEGNITKAAKEYSLPIKTIADA